LEKKRIRVIAAFLIFAICAGLFAMDMARTKRITEENRAIVYTQASDSLNWTLEMPNPHSQIYPIHSIPNQFVAYYKGFWGVIDSEGTEIIPFDLGFAEMSSYSENGLYLVAVDSTKGTQSDVLRWGYIDISGNYIIEPQYSEAEMFSGKYAAVKKDNLWKIIDMNADTVYTFNENEIPTRTRDEGIFWVEGNNLHGYINIITGKYEGVENKPIRFGDWDRVDTAKYDVTPLSEHYSYTDANGNTKYFKLFTSIERPAFGYVVVSKGPLDHGIVKLEPIE